jgi:hypothetical protein
MMVRAVPTQEPAVMKSNPSEEFIETPIRNFLAKCRIRISVRNLVECLSGAWMSLSVSNEYTGEM